MVLQIIKSKTTHQDEKFFALFVSFIHSLQLVVVVYLNVSCLSILKESHEQVLTEEYKYSQSTKEEESPE